ncbi:MAG: ferredoxin reductase family protein [Patescibacteria group bacterium]
MRKIAIYALFVANLAFIIGSWWVSSGDLVAAEPAGTLLAFGRLAGLLAVFFVLMQFVLIGRAAWIERVFGLDKLSRVHRLNGYAALGFVLLHASLIVASYSMYAKVGFFREYANLIASEDALLGAAAAVWLLVFIVFLSIAIVRRRMKYETWRFVHLFTYLAVVLAFEHQMKLGHDLTDRRFAAYWTLLYAFVFGNLAIFRFLRPLWNLWRFRFKVAAVVPETADTSSVYIEGARMEKFRVKPGQFFILRFLAKGFWRQAHPFSLSYVPKDGRLRVTIKACGDFTSTIPSLPVGAPVLIDGPHGVFTAEPKPGAKLLFIAGGVGITPIRAIIEQHAPTGDIALIYGNRDTSGIIFKQELDELSARHPFPIHHVMSADPVFAGEKGYIDKERVLRLVPDVMEREVFLCGPPVMMRGVRKALREAGMKTARVRYEEFAL